MTDTRAWIIGIVVALLLVGLIAFARGQEHQRGDEVGALSLQVTLR